MAFCQNCGSQVQGNFCPGCGMNVNATPNPMVNNPYVMQRPLSYNGKTIVEDAVVKSRYNVVHLILGSISLPLIAFGIGSIYYGIQDVINGKGVEFFIGWMLGILIGLTPILAAPVIRILRTSPKGYRIKTFVGFLLQSILFFFAWYISIIFCCFIIGLILQAWRIGLAASKTGRKHYTAFVGDQKIAVERKMDKEYSTADMPVYIYEDENGTLYRPPLYE